MVELDVLRDKVLMVVAHHYHGQPPQADAAG